MQITIEIPDDIAQRLAQAIDNLPQRALESLVVEAYRDELLTHAEVGRILNLSSRWDTDAFLKQAGADLHYDPADLQADLETLRRSRTREPSVHQADPLESDPLIALIGSIRSDVPDLADNHDRYMGQALYQEMNRVE